MFKNEYLEMFEEFLSYLLQKLQNIEMYDKFYPGAKNLIAKMIKTIEYKNNNKMPVQDCKEDNIFFNYLK